MSTPLDQNISLSTTTTTTTMSNTSEQSSDNDAATTTTSGAPSATKAAEAASTIDSALLAALREPRERMALLRLEQVLVDLIQSETDGWIEVGGPYNSRVLWPTANDTRPAAGNSYPPGMRQTTFQRCILHRLADRFGIIRENGSLLQVNPQPASAGNLMQPTTTSSTITGSIRLIKLPDSKIPNPLLQDLDPSVYGSSNNTSSNGSSGQEAVKESRTATAMKPQKMKIMKRDSRKSNKANTMAGRNNSGANRKSLVDKEKAYAEARARIFQEETLEDTGNQGSSPSSERQPNSVDNLAQGVSNLWTSETTEDAGRLFDTGSSNSLRRSSSSLNNMSNAGASAVRIDGTATPPDTATRKAVYRNYAEEAADPDFQRMRVTKSYGEYPCAQQAWHPYPGTAPGFMAPPMVATLAPAGSYVARATVASPQYMRQQPQQQQAQQNQSMKNSSSTSNRSGSQRGLTASAPAFYPDTSRYS